MIIQTIKCWPHCVGEIRLSVAHRCRACITRVAIHRQHTQHRLSACRYKTCTLTRQPHAAPHEHFCSPPSAMHITVPRRCTMITRENGQLHEARPDFYKNHSGSAFALSRSNIISNTFQLNETTKLLSTGPITSHLIMSDWNGPGLYRIEAGSKRSCRVALSGGRKDEGTKILTW